MRVVFGINSRQFSRLCLSERKIVCIYHLFYDTYFGRNESFYKFLDTPVPKFRNGKKSIFAGFSLFEELLFVVNFFCDASLGQIGCGRTDGQLTIVRSIYSCVNRWSKVVWLCFKHSDAGYKRIQRCCSQENRGVYSSVSHTWDILTTDTPRLCRKESECLNDSPRHYDGARNCVNANKRTTHHDRTELKDI